MMTSLRRIKQCGTELSTIELCCSTMLENCLSMDCQVKYPSFSFWLLVVHCQDIIPGSDVDCVRTCVLSLCPFVACFGKMLQKKRKKLITGFVFLAKQHHIKSVLLRI